jgi:hypothetical protein
MTKKVLQPTNDAYIQFTQEELQEIGAGPGTKFSVNLHDDGSIELRPYVKMEIEISDWPRELLELLITESVERDISVNDVVSDFLRKSLDNLPESVNYSKKKDYLSYTGVDPNFTNNDTGLPGGSTYPDHAV